jgi:hypothetical protein
MSNRIRCNPSGVSSAQPIPKSERGQMLPMLLMMMMAMLGITAFVVDLGRVFITYHELVATTDAAALAGAEALPSGPTATSQANTYSSASSDKNAYNNLSGVTVSSATPLCLAALQNEGIACNTGLGVYNAIQVTQTVTLPMTFAQTFGTSSVTLAATSTAAARGAISEPYNIAVIMDQTASMASSNSDACTDPTTGNTYSTRNDCSLVGLKTLLLNIAPCTANYTTCPSGGVNAVDMVSVFVFPNFQFNSGKNAYTGTCSDFTHASTYSFPYLDTGHTTYPAPATPVLSGTTSDYQLIPFQNDYRVSDLASTLNTSSNLVKILGPVGGSSCSGLGAPGGLSTFYGGALAAAQGALLQEQTARGGVSSSKNAIILLSDGAANTSDYDSIYFNSVSVPAHPTGIPLPTTATTTYPYYNSTSSKTNQCQQAVSAASQIVSNWGSTNPTVIYSVSYGATTNLSDCSTDNNKITPCQAMTKIASAPANFFSDNTAKGADKGCTASLQAATGLASIFGQIASNFTVARLIPNWTT